MKKIWSEKRTVSVEKDNILRKLIMYKRKAQGARFEERRLKPATSCGIVDTCTSCASETPPTEALFASVGGVEVSPRF